MRRLGNGVTPVADSICVDCNCGTVAANGSDITEEFTRSPHCLAQHVSDRRAGADQVDTDRSAANDLVAVEERPADLAVDGEKRHAILGQTESRRLRFIWEQSEGDW